MTSTPANDLLDELNSRLNVAKAAENEARQHWNHVSNLRLAVAAIAIGFGFWWLRTGDHSWGLATAAMVIIFALCLVWHYQLGKRLNRSSALVTVRMQAIARVNRDWAALPVPEIEGVDPGHPYAFDLDLLGHGSLLQLIHTTETAAGRANLSRWLLGESPREEIAFRQQVARDLVNERDWREDLQSTGMVARSGEDNPERLLFWLDEMARRRYSPAHIIAVLLAPITIGMVLAYLFGQISFVYVTPLLVLNSLIWTLSSKGGWMAGISGSVFTSYRHALPLVERIPGTSPEVAAIRSDLQTDGKPASAHLALLDRALSMSIPSSSMLWFAFQIALNWDLLVDAVLIRTARGINGQARGWIETIGTVEAIAALAGAADLNPDWTFPTVVDQGNTLLGSDLGHPLIPAGRMVTNDLTIGPPGQVLIVTGSNMAGKSTLLRTTGLNAVLALAGGPVCATSLTVPNQPVWSSVRIQDSLEQGVSLYMAELLRLKAIVDAAERGPIIYLLDEILHGTNTTERRIAARQVISRLLRTESIGIVSTHDLELIDEHLAERSTCVHLVDQVNDSGYGPAMTFDYKVRPGLAPTSNALRLLRMVGLADEPAD